MNRDFTIYLAGPIQGFSYTGACAWRTTIEKAIGEDMIIRNPMRHKEALAKIESLDGAYSELSALCTPQAIVTRDRNDVKSADLIVVYYPDDRCDSFGTAVEIGWSTAQHKPVVMYMPRTNRLKDHPFIAGLGIPVVHDLETLLEFIYTIRGI